MARLHVLEDAVVKMKKAAVEPRPSAPTGPEDDVTVAKTRSGSWCVHVLGEAVSQPFGTRKEAEAMAYSLARVICGREPRAGWRSSLEQPADATSSAEILRRHPEGVGAVWGRFEEVSTPRLEADWTPDAELGPSLNPLLDRMDSVASLPEGAALPPVHPGEILLFEFLEPSGLSMIRAAKRMGVPRTRIERLVAGQTAMTEDTALRLEALFGASAEFWMALQTRYALAEARRNADPAIATIARLEAVPAP